MTAPFVWSPSGLRTIGLFGTATDPRPGRAMAVLPLRWPDHPAAAVLDYSIDAAGLRDGDADTISITARAATGIDVPATLVHGALVTLWLGPGSAPIGTDALIDLTLATAGGRRVNRIIRLRIR